MAGEVIGNGPDAVVRRLVRERTGPAPPDRRLTAANRIGGAPGGQAERPPARRRRLQPALPYSGR